MRMMPVGGNAIHPRRRIRVRLNSTVLVGLLHLAAAGIAAMALAAVWVSVSRGNSGYFSFFFDWEYRPIAYIHNEHVTRIDMPVLYAYFLLLLAIHGAIVGICILKRRRWGWNNARITPVMALPLWATFAWYLAEYSTLARANFRVSSDSMLNPPVLLSDIRTAAVYTFCAWLLSSSIYWWMLKISESRSNIQPENAVSLRIRAARAVLLVVAALLLLLNLRMPDGRILVHDMASYGWTGTVNLLRMSGQSINAHTVDGSTPLHLAAASGRVSTIESLLDYGADINSRNALGYTAEMIAATSDWTFPAHDADPCAALLTLIRRGADVRLRDSDGLTVANHLIGQPVYPSEIVKLIVKRGVPINIGVTDEWINFTLLGYAVECGQPEDVDFLLSHNTRMYPHLVVRANPGMLRHLLECGFDVNSRDEDGKTPLHYVMQREQENGTDDGKACALVLLEYGADINAQDSRGQTLLHYAAESHDYEWARFLLDHGADRNIGN